MPALPPVAKVVRIDHHMDQGTDANAMIRSFFQYSGTLNATDAATWLTNINTGFRSFLTSVMSTGLSLILSELTDLTSPTSVQVQNATGGSGGISGSILPAGTAMVIRHHISRRYRGSHPRVYLPGMVFGYLNGPQLWNPTDLGNIVGFYTTYIGTVTSVSNPAAIGAIEHVNVSYYSGFTNHTYPSGRVRAIPTLRVTPLVDQVLAYVGNPNVASQRRRNETP